VRRLEGFGGVVVLGDLMDQLAVELIEHAAESVAQPHGASDDRVKDRLDVSLRLADDAQDLSCRRLLLQRLGDLRVRLGQSFILLLELGEQPDVLDRDDRLVGKSLEQRDLSLRERAHLCAPEQDHSDRLARTEQGNTEHRAVAPEPREVAALGVLVHFGLHVGDLDGSPLQHDAPDKHPPHQRERYIRRDPTFVGSETHRVAIGAEDGGVVGVAQASRARRYRLEHGLNIRGRARDDPQNLPGSRLLLQSLFRFLEQPHVLDRDHGLVGEGLQ
jgi:hypothetical protein